MSDKTKAKPEAAPATEPGPVLATAAPAITENRWVLKEHRNPGYWVCVPVGTTREQLLDPATWANVARHMRPNSTIEVHWDDSSQFAELYVLSCGRNWASVSLLRHVPLAKPQVPQSAVHYGIAFNGPVDRFRVTRLGDGAVLQAGFDSESAARKWLDEYLRKLAA